MDARVVDRETFGDCGRVQLKVGRDEDERRGAHRRTDRMELDDRCEVDGVVRAECAPLRECRAGAEDATEISTIWY